MHANPLHAHHIAGIILAGGQSSRFGYQDKSWAILNNQSLIASLIATVNPQVATLSISSNSTAQALERFKAFNLPILADTEYPKKGPLSGVLSGLKWAKKAGFEWLATFPVDTPNIADDFIHQMIQKKNHSNCQRIIASDAEYEQNTLGLWSVNLLKVIRHGLQQGHNKINHCLQNEPYETVLFNQPFLNINTPNLLKKAKQLETF